MRTKPKRPADRPAPELLKIEIMPLDAERLIAIQQQERNLAAARALILSHYTGLAQQQRPGIPLRAVHLDTDAKPPVLIYQVLGNRAIALTNPKPETTNQKPPHADPAENA